MQTTRALSATESLAVRSCLASARRLLTGSFAQQSQLHTSSPAPLHQTTQNSAQHTVAHDQTLLLSHDLTQLRQELERAQLLRITTLATTQDGRKNIEDLVSMYEKSIERAELGQLVGRLVEVIKSEEGSNEGGRKIAVRDEDGLLNLEI